MVVLSEIAEPDADRDDAGRGFAADVAAPSAQMRHGIGRRTRSRSPPGPVGDGHRTCSLNEHYAHSSACVTWQNISSAAAHAVDTGSMCTWLKRTPVISSAANEGAESDHDGSLWPQPVGRMVSGMRGGMTRGLLRGGADLPDDVALGKRRASMLDGDFSLPFHCRAISRNRSR